ncbi:hypothetical protein GCM10022222_09700 [Amycolatopsis ultiminotia]|uniref:Secreted protein n=1 Tax=Amycolatopsis ultiminotia TaxID=543629 RepID=A0ABP6V4P0_9PSEU
MLNPSRQPGGALAVAVFVVLQAAPYGLASGMRATLLLAAAAVVRRSALLLLGRVLEAGGSGVAGSVVWVGAVVLSERAEVREEGEAALTMLWRV